MKEGKHVVVTSKGMYGLEHPSPFVETPNLEILLDPKHGSSVFLFYSYTSLGALQLVWIGGCSRVCAKTPCVLFPIFSMEWNHTREYKNSI